MIEVGKQAPDFELASHLAGTKRSSVELQGTKERHVGVLSAGLDTYLKHDKQVWCATRCR